MIYPLMMERHGVAADSIAARATSILLRGTNSRGGNPLSTILMVVIVVGRRTGGLPLPWLSQLGVIDRLGGDLERIRPFSVLG